MKKLLHLNIYISSGRTFLWNSHGVNVPFKKYWIDFGLNRKKRIIHIRTSSLCYDIITEYTIGGNLDYYLINPEEWEK